MNKEQQIEEMAVIGCVRNPQAYTAEECAKCDFKNGQCNSYRHAEALYNAGYRKTFTSDLASDTQKAYKEGYIKGFADGEEEFEIIKNRNAELIKERDGAKAEYDLAKALHDEKCAEFDKLCYDYWKLKAEKAEYEKPIDKFIKDREAKAVKKFADKLKGKLQDFGDGGEKGAYITEKDIYELLKEYEK